MKNFIHIFILMNFFIFGAHKVKVGAYLFPPYLNISNTNTSGKTVDLINALNSTQNKYKFEVVVTSPKRRYADLENKFDIIFFEDNNWGWKGKNIESISLSMKDRELFISLTDYYSDTNFVKDIKTKKILITRGFHYAFANFNSSEDYLTKNFNAVITNSPQNTMDFLFSGRAQIAIITESFLKVYLSKYPEKKEKILINETPDQIYELVAIKNKKSAISIEELSNLIEKLKKENKYKYIFE